MSKFGKQTPLETRIETWIATAQTNASGCWLWSGSTNGVGYGMVTLFKQHRTIHSVFYEHFIGSVPEGKELDHKCRNRNCFNPNHLEAVTRRENLHRGSHQNMKSHMSGLCKLGHPLVTISATDRSSGKRGICRICTRRRSSEHTLKRRENKHNIA